MLAYSTVPGLFVEWGKEQVSQWSGMDGTGAPDMARIENALALAEAKIDKIAARCGVLSDPQGGHLIITEPAAQAIVAHWVYDLAAVHLYEHAAAGRDASFNTRMGPIREETLTEIHKTLSGDKNLMNLGLVRRWPQGDAPMGYACNPNRASPSNRFGTH